MNIVTIDYGQISLYKCERFRTHLFSRDWKYALTIASQTVYYICMILSMRTQQVSRYAYNICDGLSG